MNFSNSAIVSMWGHKNSVLFNWIFLWTLRLNVLSAIQLEIGDSRSWTSCYLCSNLPAVRGGPKSSDYRPLSYSLLQSKAFAPNNSP
jgi:hypothetical protein